MTRLFKPSRNRLYTTLILVLVSLLGIGYYVDHDYGMLAGSVGLFALGLQDVIAVRVVRGVLVVFAAAALTAGVAMTWLAGDRWYPVTMGLGLVLVGAYYVVRGWNQWRHHRTTAASSADD